MSYEFILENNCIPLGQTSSIGFPFSRLDREPFWELVPQPGTVITPAIINTTTSVTCLRKYALGAKLDDGLFRVMQSGEWREALREALLQSCFSAEVAVLLREQSIINCEAFYYSQTACIISASWFYESARVGEVSAKSIRAEDDLNRKYGTI